MTVHFLLLWLEDSPFSKENPGPSQCMFLEKQEHREGPLASEVSCTTHSSPHLLKTAAHPSPRPFQGLVFPSLSRGKLGPVHSSWCVCQLLEMSGVAVTMGKEVRKVTLGSSHSTRKRRLGYSAVQYAVVTLGKPSLLLGLHAAPEQ